MALYLAKMSVKKKAFDVENNLQHKQNQNI